MNPKSTSELTSIRELDAEIEDIENCGKTRNQEPVPEIDSPQAAVSLVSLIYDIKKYKDSNPKAAELALKKLMKACHKGLLAFAYHEKENAGPRYDAEQMVSETFTRAYEKTDTLKLDEKLSESEKDKKTWNWLATILINRIHQFRRKKGVFFDDLKKMPRPPDWDTMSLIERIERKKWYKEQLNPEVGKLSEAEKLLLKISVRYYDEDNEKSKIPKKVRQALARKFKITEATLRQRRKRLIKRLQDAVLKFPQPKTFAPPPTSKPDLRDYPEEDLVNDFLGDEPKPDEE